MSRSDSPEGGQVSGGYKSKSPSSASLEAWRSNVTPDRDLPGVADIETKPSALETLTRLRDQAEDAGDWPRAERYEAELEALDEETP
jgi:hypothetical protein